MHRKKPNRYVIDVYDNQVKTLNTFKVSLVIQVRP